MSWDAYYLAATVAPEALSRIEAELAGCPGDEPVRAAELHRKVVPGYSRDTVLLCLNALQQQGALRIEREAGFVVDPGAFRDSAEVRAAVRRALQWRQKDDGDDFELLVSSPQDTAAAPDYNFTRELSDLRTAVRSLIASARETLLLASPFWDLDVAADLATLISRRVSDGVRVHVLSRNAKPDTPAGHALGPLRKALGDRGPSGLRVLDVPSRLDPFGSVTFHFKLAVADHASAYLGSANFTTAGLASRWELGVLLRGSAARTLGRLGEALYAAGEVPVDS